MVAPKNRSREDAETQSAGQLCQLEDSNPYKSPTALGNAPTPLLRMPWFRRFSILGGVGLAVTVGAMFYGAMTIGVPYQDPTPEMARREAVHLAVSSWAMIIGSCMILVAIVGDVAILIGRAISKLTR